ncbi:MAG: M1 family metallopeptidase [Proteobacteria bacterium]|nr:M1 family metallopeptidase [Pseudomonadota bacterium]
MKRNTWCMGVLWLSSLACAGTRPSAGAPPPLGGSPKLAETTPRQQEASNQTRLPPPPQLRLPRTLVPERNRVQLVLDPAQPTFSGRIQITARVTQPSSFFWLNAQDISVEAASISVGQQTLPLEWSSQPRDFVGLRAPRPIAPGVVVLDLRYRGKIDALETHGIFRQQVNDEWFLFTQFEPLSARRAFPCFDEPDNKVPWQLTLEVPEDLVALANTPAERTERGSQGNKVVHFAASRPLPSYLVAFAVGPFALVDAGKSRNGTPIRVVVPRGHEGDVGYVTESTASVLALLEDYFAMQYPYAKLDLVAIPITVGFGAMEHPGLITYVQSLLVSPPDERTISFQRRYVAVTAHELAHQWFGNLVTMDYWNDLWLNEAFASWMGAKITHQLRPEWDGDVGMVRRRARALNVDRLVSARKIRQPIDSAHDIMNAFDGITYSKGASVITMFEAWVGERAFRAGVRNYVRKHAWSNASSDDFLRAISNAMGRDVGRPFSTFLDRAGAPLLTFGLECAPGKTARVSVRQERSLPLGSQARAAQDWELPVCVSYRAGGKMAHQCTLVDQPSATFDLEQAKDCPAWLLPNRGMRGYYHSAFEQPLLAQLLRYGLNWLTVPELVGLLSDVNALVAAGKADASVALRLVTRLAKHEDRHVVSQSAAIASGIDDLVAKRLRPHYARFVRRMFGRRARSLGWTPGRDDDEDMRLLRGTVLSLVTDQGRDRKLARGATALAGAWLKDRRALDPNLVGTALGAAARFGDEALWTRLYEAAKAEKDRRHRRQLLGALSSFREPELVSKSLQLLLADEFDPRESMGLLFGALRDEKTRHMAYRFVKENYDHLLEKLPKRHASSLIRTASAQCKQDLRAEIEALFKPKMQQLPGGPRTYAKAMEQLDLCIKRRAAQAPSVARFLERY